MLQTGSVSRYETGFIFDSWAVAFSLTQSSKGRATHFLFSINRSFHIPPIEAWRSTMIWPAEILQFHFQPVVELAEIPVRPGNLNLDPCTAPSNAKSKLYTVIHG